MIQNDFFGKQNIEISIDSSAKEPTPRLVSKILDAAKDRNDNSTGTVLQHLVGAKLTIRFPEIEIGKDKATAADQQTGRHGDFTIGQTVFHITTSPMQKLIEVCENNIKEGLRPIIITPTNRVLAARQMVENSKLDEKVQVIAAEDFIGTNIEEVSIYESEKIANNTKKFIQTYNERIELIESDKSLKIKEPVWFSEDVN